MLRAAAKAARRSLPTPTAGAVCMASMAGALTRLAGAAAYTIFIRAPMQSVLRAGDRPSYHLRASSACSLSHDARPPLMLPRASRWMAAQLPPAATGTRAAAVAAAVMLPSAAMVILAFV